VDWSDNQSSQCPICERLYAERTPPGTPPCESCRVELREENAEAAMVYMSTRRQIITMFNGEYDKEIDLNYVALISVMDLFGVKNKRECFKKVVHTYHHFLRLRDENC
jgi:hypothetical protein